MKHKTKLSILVVISSITVIGVLTYVGLNKRNKIPAEVQNVVVEEVKNEQQSQGEISAKNKTYQELQPDMKTIVIPGKVVSSGIDSVEILNNGTENTFILKGNVLIISMKDGGEKKAISDIKKGDTVSVVLNAANSEVVGIQIENAKK